VNLGHYSIKTENFSFFKANFPELELEMGLGQNIFGPDGVNFLLLESAIFALGLGFENLP